MATDDSLKKLRRKKNPMKKKIEEEEANSELGSSRLQNKERNSYRANEEDKKNKNKKKKKNSPLNIANEVDSKDETHDVSGGNKKSKKSRNNKRKKIEELGAEQSNEVEDGISGEKYVESVIVEEDKLQKKSRKKKRISNGDEVSKKGDASEKQKGKSKKAAKRKQRSRAVANELSVDSLLEKGEDVEDEVYEMSSGDEDNSKGMKKWIMQYHQSRPGLEVLQERIDDFIVAHEAKEEQAKLEREAKAAEGGWTVVVHHKGRKKTTEDETGVAVGSVAQAAVLDKMAKKKNKEVGLDFYRFQKREAQRNEVMMLQSKFEEDKKRIQQLRAARKFRPY
ncbi:hypothetical protein ACP275_11G113700 [Erythranthe tilingii]